MRHRSVIAALVLATFASGLAAAQDEPDRACTLTDIDAALSGTYAGPGCRFTIEASPDEADSTGSRPVVLQNSFFHGPGSGGVERPAAAFFLYRGMVLVSSGGDVRMAPLPVSGGVVRLHDGVRSRVPVTAPVIAPRRAYPGH